MNQISCFFRKFSLALLKDEEARTIAQDSIRRLCLCTLDKKQLKVSNGIVFVKAHPMVRERILSKKKRLIEECKEKGLEVWNVV